MMEQLTKVAKKVIPSLDAILDEAWDQLKPEPRYVNDNFGTIWVSLDRTATQIFRDYEREALSTLAVSWLNQQEKDIRNKLNEIITQHGWDEFVETASKLFVDFGILVQSLEKDLGNMRKARGGKTFEKALLRLLTLINIKGENPRGKKSEELKRIDIVIPSMEVALATPDKAIFLTCKRTLRERWKQEVPQARLNQRIYLLTIDEDLSENKANEINEKGFIAFVRDELVDHQVLQNMPWIRKLAELPTYLRKV